MTSQSKNTGRATPRLSILICTLDGHLSLAQTLPALFDSISGHTGIEVLVVDDGSAKQTRNFLEAQGFRLRVISHSKNLGRGSARQTALEGAAGEYVAFIDDDIVVSRAWVTNLIEALSKFESEKIKGIGGPCEIQDDKTLTNLYLKFRNPFSLYEPAGSGLINRLKRQLNQKAQNNLPEFWTVENLLGGNMIFRRFDLQEVGGFNVNLRHGEDDEICSRLKARFGSASLLGMRSLAVEHIVDENMLGFLERQFRYAKSSGAKFRNKPGIPSLNIAAVTFLGTVFYDFLVVGSQKPELLLFGFLIPYVSTPGWFYFAKHRTGFKKFLLPFLSWVVGVLTFSGFVVGLVEAADA